MERRIAKWLIVVLLLAGVVGATLSDQPELAARLVGVVRLLVGELVQAEPPAW